MIRFLLYAGLAYLVWRWVRATLLPGPENRTRVDSAPGKEIDDVMVQDPQCGVYFPFHQGVIARVKGEKYVFCSEKCRDEYIQNNQGS